MSIIDVRLLTKWYGPVPAVREISFQVQQGEVVGFLGPNGAGKSTTLRILAGFIGASSGEVRVAGHDVAKDPQRVQAALGYMPESSPLYPEMRVVEYLRFRAELKQLPRGRRAAAVEGAARDAGLDEMLQRPIDNLSKGYRQRVGLADALLGEPPLLILDEPTAGLDPNQVREVRTLVKRLRDKHTIFLSTHILSEVEAVCSRAVVVARGRVVADGTLDDLRARRRSSELVLRTARQDEAGLVAAKVEGVESFEDGPDGLVVRLSPDASRDDVAERLVHALVTAGVAVRELRPGKTSLEEVFAELTRDRDGSPEDAADDHDASPDGSDAAA